MKPVIFFSLFAWVLVSCSPLKKIAFEPHQSFNEQAVSDSIRIEFNGTACFYIQYKGSALLTDPFITNPSFRKVTFGKIKSDTLLLNRLQPKTNNIKLLSIGHAHYDHILDLPYFVTKLNSNTKIVGSQNMVAMANTLNVSQTVVDIAALKATETTVGVWVYAADSSMRIMAAKSAHLPHLLGIHLYHGKLKKPIQSFPVKGKHFLEDETLAFMVDYLDAALQPEKRIYFSSSSVSYPNGFFPKEMLNEKEVDIAIVSTALLQKAKGYPHGLIEYLKPKHTLLCHWENFFKTREQKLKPVSLTRHKKMFAALQDLKGKTAFHYIKPGNSWIMP